MDVKQWVRDQLRSVKFISGWLNEAYENGKRVGRSELFSEIESRERLLKIGRRELHVETVGARAYCSIEVPCEERKKYAQRLIAENICAALLPYIAISEVPGRTEPGLIRYDGTIRVVIDG